ncbi:MAG: hypothetical protein M1399_04255 [Actinobacteria bacterium]|nr:hypothetical protein [Actinomycetota bacterium]MCL5446951.1 hypothetical protein [Actinomycetota bacterium]
MKASPTAWQDVAEAQEIPVTSSMPAGRDSAAQLVPFQERTLCPLDPNPTAWQDVAETQETPKSIVTPEGRGSCVQVVPLKERATPVGAPPVDVKLAPTAWQNVAETQETPSSSLVPDGRVSCVQAVPLKEMAAPLRAPPVVPPVDVKAPPTAWQDVAETQETLLRPPIPEGRVSAFQAVPLKERATPVAAPPVVLLVDMTPSPTAWQLDMDMQDIAARLYSAGGSGAATVSHAAPPFVVL